jgi:uncharacterized protein (TIGR02996 family)
MPSATTDLRTSIERAAKAGDPRATIEQLIALWQESPANAIADSLDKLTKAALPKSAPASVEEAVEDVLELPRLLDRLREGNAATAAGQISKMRAVTKDPRVAAAIVRLLEDPPWHATGSKPFWTRLFDLLDENQDPRSIAKLQKIDYSKIINGKSMRGWMQTQVEKAIASLEKASLATAKVSKDDRAALEKIKLAPPKGGPAPTKGGKVSEAALLKAVYENPDDDAPRAVLADFLMEKGDPRGELIALQLGERTPATEKRALTLIRKNQKAWLGPIAPYVKFVAYPSVAEKDPLGIHLWWKRGFPAGAILAITKPKLIELADLPIWATFERLRNLDAANWKPDPEWDQAMLRLLKSLRGLKDLATTNVPLLMLGKNVPGFLERIEQMSIGIDENRTEDGAEHIALMKNLKRLWINHWEDLPRFKPIFDAKFLTHLEEFELECEGGVIRLVPGPPPGGGLALTLTPSNAKLTAVVKDLASSKTAAAIKTISFANTKEKQRKEFTALFPKAKVVELPKKKKTTTKEEEKGA